MSRQSIAVTLACLSATLILSACEGGKSEVTDSSVKGAPKTYSFDVNEHASDGQAKSPGENIIELDKDAQKLAELQAGDAQFGL